MLVEELLGDQVEYAPTLHDVVAHGPDQVLSEHGEREQLEHEEDKEHDLGLFLVVTRITFERARQHAQLLLYYFEQVQFLGREKNG